MTDSSVHSSLSDGGLAAIMDHLGEGVYALDRNGCLTYMNPAAERLLGWSREDLMGRNMHDAIHFQRADGRPLSEAECPLLAVERSGQPIRVEDDVFTRRNGSLLPVSYVSAPVFEDGRITGTVLAFHDRTETRRIEEELRWQKTLLEAQHEASPDGLLAVSLDGRIIFMNEHFRQMWHIPDDIGPGGLNSRVLEFTSRHVVDADAYRERVEYLYTHPNEPTEDRVVLRDGRVVERYSAPVVGAHGQVYGRISFFRDITDRVRSDLSLLDLTQRLRALIDVSPLAIMMFDFEGIVHLWNPAAERIFGWSAEEVMGGQVPVIFPDRQEEFRRSLSDLLEGEEVQAVETIRHTKDGRALHVSMWASVIRDGAGHPTGVLGIVDDISRRKAAEGERLEALHREQEARLQAEMLAREVEDARATADRERQRLQTLFMQAPIRIAVTRGPEHIYEFVNETYMRDLGNREDMIGRRAVDVFPEAAEQGLIGVADQVYRSGEPYVGIEAPFAIDYDGDGQVEEQYANVSIQPVRGTDNSIEGLMLVSLDVTEQVLARRRIEQLAAERQAMLRQMTEGIIVADPDGVITFINRAAADIYQVNTTGVGPDQYSSVFHVYTTSGAPVQGELSPLYRAAHLGETTVNQEAVVWRPDGREILIQRSAAPILAEDGTRLGAVMAVRDITEQRAIEQQKNDFLAAAAHDLKTPLTTIKGLAQVLHRQAAVANDPRGLRTLDNLARIEGAATRMNNLIDELLDATRLQMGHQIELRQRPTDLVTLARQVIGDMRRSSPVHHLVLDAAQEEIWGLWDAGRLERVLTNLLSNAIKYSPDGGVVTVRVWQEGEKGFLSVTDEGVGIAPEDIGRIFEQFYRARNVQGMLPGTGIGLAGARRIVEQHHGSITVESEPGVGSVFTVSLPLQPNG